MTYFEKDAIVSGLGISRIGRRTGIPGLELTMEAVRAAIEDAGLSPADIDGIATLGDTPAADVNAELRIEAADCGAGFGTGGLLSPVMSACRAVAERRARHVVIYRTIQMLGGTVPVKREENAPAPAPFGLLDCDVPVDGSIAVVVSNAEYARDCPHRAVAVEAIGGSDGAGGWFHRDDYPKMAMSDATAQMWSRTQLTPADLDLAELYDGFTFLTLAWLEALGVCGDGEAGPFVEGGTRIARDGQLPLNTYGGQLSAGRMHGYWALHEGCLQLRGEAGERQVSKRPEVAVVSVGGGPVAGCMLLTC
jgi:acetyl-CoA acetyltransferase